jgi:metal-responsive CopG/Arc/MetJ family transcriptional regulator
MSMSNGSLVRVNIFIPKELYERFRAYLRKKYGKRRVQSMVMEQLLVKFLEEEKGKQGR